MGISPLDILSAGTSLASGAVSSAMDYQSQKRAQEYATAAYKHRYQWTVQDLQKAGLNPALAYGQGTGGQAQTVAPAQPGTSFVRGAQSAAATQQAMANAELTRDQANLLKAQTADLVQQVKLRNAEILTHAGEMGARGGLLMLEQDKINKVMEGLDYDNQFKKATVNTKIEIVKKELEKQGVQIDYITAQKVLAHYASGLGKAEFDYYSGIGKYSPLLNDASQLFRNFIPKVNIFGERNTYNTMRPYR